MGARERIFRAGNPHFLLAVPNGVVTVSGYTCPGDLHLRTELLPRAVLATLWTLLAVGWIYVGHPCMCSGCGTPGEARLRHEVRGSRKPRAWGEPASQMFCIHSHEWQHPAWRNQTVIGPTCLSTVTRVETSWQGRVAPMRTYKRQKDTPSQVETEGTNVQRLGTTLRRFPQHCRTEV